MGKKVKQLKKTLVRKVQYLFENITSIHGINHLNNERGIRLALWILLLLLNLMGTVFFIIIAREKYYDDQTVTAINDSCTVNSVPFPAVSICNVNLVSLKDIKYIKKLLIHYNRTEDEITDFFQALPRLNNYSIYIGKNRNFTEIMTILKRHYFTMDTIMEEIHQKCSDLLVACSFNRKEKVCGEIFYKIKTFEGFCCAFNYAALNDASESAMAPHDNDFDYYEDMSNDKGIGARLISTSESGRLSGLFVAIDVEPDQYPPWSLTPFYGAKILVSDPTDYPETSVKYRFVSPGEVVSVKVQPMVYQTSPELRRLEPSMRRCLFHNEVNLAHANKYSFETCHTECRMDTFVRKCNCIPYKYPRDRRARICELEDTDCLHNITVYVSKTERVCHPACQIECSDKKYTVLSDTTAFLSEHLPINISSKNIKNMSHLAGVQVYFRKTSFNCYELNLLIDFNYFIANYGGVLSLSLGASILTIIELSYLVLSYLVRSCARIIHVQMKNQ